LGIMPWKKVTSMDAITRFVMQAQSDRFTITELCEQFGISRKTGYKHLERYAESGLKGLAERSHRPRHFPQITDEAVEALIVEERRRHRTWGPEKAAQGSGSETWHRIAAGTQAPSPGYCGAMA